MAVCRDFVDMLAEASVFAERTEALGLVDVS
jgi:hypothetical protein